MNKLLLALLLVALGVSVYFGTRNRPDSLWQEANSLLEQEYLMLDEAADSLEVLYNSFHGKPQELPHDSTALKLMRAGQFPTKQWSKFQEFFSLVTKQKSVVVASINGSGATTFTSKMGEFLATSPDHLLRIKCAPQYDLMMHQKYIGTEVQGKWQNGLLLNFWDKAMANPSEHFVALIDNFDKINPETFFGPEIWEILDDRNRTTILGNREVKVPENFYIISVTHAGLASKMEFTNEHFRRLGNQFILPVSPIELVEYLRNRKKEINSKLDNTTDASERGKLQTDLAALSDKNNLQRFVFTFMSCNRMVDETYGNTSQLGQWNAVRKLYKPNDLPTIIQNFITHINSLKPEKSLREKDFDNLRYTLNTNGLAPRSSWVFQVVRWLQETGYFVEITLILGTSLITALAGWWVVRRRENILRKYGERSRAIFSDYEAHLTTPEQAAEKLRNIKDEIDHLVLQRKLNYTEALYFLGFIEDKMRSIEYARETAQTFQDLYDSFYEDGVFTNTEYKKIRSFLNSIRHRIPDQVFERFQQMVEQTQRGV